jgi:hypothetical protein
METETPDGQESSAAPPTYIWWPLQDGEVYLVAGKPAEHWVLDLVGAFASLQDGIELILAMYLRRFSPAVTKKITKNHLRRLKDEERWDYVKALASDVGYTGDLLQPASDAFLRCKDVRDLVAHQQSGLMLVRAPDNPTYHYSVPPRPRTPNPLTPETFRLLAAEVRWLNAFLDHLGYLAGLRYASPMGRVGADGKSEPRWIEILEPPRLPIAPDWTNEGLFREIDDER